MVIFFQKKYNCNEHTSWYVRYNIMELRQQILEAMYGNVRLHGFQGLRADKVITELGVTKGGLYHYFPNKQAIGISIIDEIIEPMFLKFYGELQRSSGDPIPMLQEHLRWLSGICTDEEAALGCPLNNLVQEMSPLDEDFRTRLQKILNVMQSTVAEALRRGQDAGLLKTTFDCDATAWFYLASIEGAYSMAKVNRSAQTFKRVNQQIINYFETLRK